MNPALLAAVSLRRSENGITESPEEGEHVSRGSEIRFSSRIMLQDLLVKKKRSLGKEGCCILGDREY